MQCKDIPEIPILELLLKHRGRTCTWYRKLDHSKFGMPPSVCDAFPAEANDKLIIAKMRILIKRGLVDGCGCGCRGDFEITAKGIQFLVDDAIDTSDPEE